MTVPFGQQQERYTSSLFLVLCNRLLSSLTALVLLLVCSVLGFASLLVVNLYMLTVSLNKISNGKRLIYSARHLYESSSV